MIQDIRTFKDKLNEGKGFEKDPLLHLKIEATKKVVRHSKGLYIDELIKEFRPNLKDDAIRQRQTQAKALTKSAMVQTKDAIYKQTEDSRFSYKGVEPDVLKYADQAKTLKGCGFKNFVMSDVSNHTFDDPNGYIAVLPTEKHYTDSTVNEFTFAIIPTQCVICTNFEGEKVLAWYSSETVYDKKDPKKYANAVYVLDDTNFYIFDPVEFGSKCKYAVRLKDNKIETYVHKIGSIPATLLGGDAVQVVKGKASFTYYESFLEPATSWGDLFLQFFSDYTTIFKNVGSPLLVMEVSVCGTCGGQGKTQWHNEETGKNDKVTCVRCQGKGQIGSITADGVFVKEVGVKKSFNDGDTPDHSKDPIRYILPPSDAINAHATQTYTLFNMYREALGLVREKEKQSEGSKDADLENQRAFIIKVCSNLARLMSDLLTFIGQYVNPDNTKRQKVEPPKTFKLRTANDLYTEFTTLLAEGANFSVIYPVYLDYLHKRFEGDECTLKINTYLACYDVTMFVNEIRLNELLTNNVINENDLTFSVYASKELYKLCSLDEGKFLEMSDEDITNHINKTIQNRLVKLLPNS